MSIKRDLWKYLYIYVLQVFAKIRTNFRENVNNFRAIVCGNGNRYMIFGETNGSNGFAKIGKMLGQILQNTDRHFAHFRQISRICLPK